MVTEQSIKGNFIVNHRVFPSSDHLVMKEIFEQNCYGIRQDLIGNGVIIDIGANIGCFTLLASQYADVYSYEPQGDNYELLLQNISKNKLSHTVHPYKLAIGKKGFSTINNAHGCSIVGMGEEKIEVIDINEVMDKFDNIDFVKIDCERGEHDIFETISEENINKIKYLGIEIHSQDDRIDKTKEKVNKYFVYKNRVYTNRNLIKE